jgi:hypothetical protein
LAPTSGGDELGAQIELGRRYYAALVRIENIRRARYRSIRRELGDLEALELRVKEATATVDAIFERVTEEKKITRSKRASPGLAAELSAAKEQRKVASDAMKLERERVEAILSPPRDELKRRRVARAMRADGTKVGPRTVEKINADTLQSMLEEPVWHEVWKRIAMNDARAEKRVKRMRAAARACGLGSGTYLLQDKAIEAAKSQQAGVLSVPRRGHGEGRVGVQLRDVTVGAALTGVATAIQLELRPWERKGDRSRAFGTVTLWVRRDASITLPVQVHREAPGDALVKMAWVQVFRIGRRLRYELQLTLESQKLIAPRSGARAGTVAVNFGWRQVQGGVRVAYATDDMGTARELVLREDGVLGALRKPEELRAISDLHFNAARDELRRWLKANEAAAWLAEATATLPYWRAHGELARVAYRWARELVPDSRIAELWHVWLEERLHGAVTKRDLLDVPTAVEAWLLGRGVPAYATTPLYLEWWRRKNRHLQDWETNQRQKATNRRNDLYRCWAKALAKDYEALVIEGFDMRRTAERGQDEAPPEARHQRFLAAPSELRQYLVEAFSGQVQKVSAKDATMTCSACGERVEAKPDDLFARCLACERVVDRDRNNCENQLARARERSGGDDPPGGSRGGRKDAGSVEPAAAE